MLKNYSNTNFLMIIPRLKKISIEIIFIFIEYMLLHQKHIINFTYILTFYLILVSYMFLSCFLLFLTFSYFFLLFLTFSYLFLVSFFSKNFLKRSFKAIFFLFKDSFFILKISFFDQITQL